MPDINGWPLDVEVLAQVATSAPDGATTALLPAIGTTLQAVIAEFQSPPAFDGSGGTGRRFTPVTETRTFDGSGYHELAVSDIVPGTPLSASVWGTPLASVVLKQSYDGMGANTLAFPGCGYLYGYGLMNQFPSGLQNIAVTATWGYAAQVPADVYRAVLSETSYRALVENFVPLSGIGETVSIGDFEINTSAGVSVWAKSSPIAVYHQIYQDCIKRYRVGNGPKLKQLAASRRMS